MKSLLFALALATAPMTLSACATTPDAHMAQGRATATSWAALDAVAVTVDGLAVSHVLHGQKAADAAAALIKARDALLAADAAYRMGDNATAEQNVVTAAALISTLILLTQEAK